MLEQRRTRAVLLELAERRLAVLGEELGDRSSRVRARSRRRGRGTAGRSARAASAPSVVLPAPMKPTSATCFVSGGVHSIRSTYARHAATKSPSASPPNFSRAARASSHATAASATTASASTAETSLRSTSACAGSPVSRSTDASGFISVGSGFIAARTTISSPFDMPPSMPPARFVVAVEAALVADDLVVRLGAAQPREREAVADLDALHRLDAHQRRGEPRVEPVLLARVRAEPGRDAARAHLDDAAERVAVLARRVDRRRVRARLGQRRAGDRRSRSRRAAPSRPRRRRRARPCGARTRARARRARRRARTSARPRGRRDRAAAASPASSPCPPARPRAATGSSPTSSSCGRGCGRRARAACRASGRAAARRAPRPRPSRSAGAASGRSPAGGGAGRRRSPPGRGRGPPGGPRDDRDERRPVRLAGGGQLERHAGKPSAAAHRRHTGAGTPVQSSNDAAPCADEHLEPVEDARAGARAAASAVAVARVRRGRRASGPAPSSTSTSSRTGVALTTRSRRSRRAATRRGARTTRTCRGARPERRRRAAVADHGRRAPTSSPARISVSVLKPRSARRAKTSVFTDGSRPLADEPRHRRLVRGRDVRAGEAERGEPAHRLLEPLGRDVERDVDPVEPARRERRVLHPRRERVRDRMAEQRDELGHVM